MRSLQPSAAARGSTRPDRLTIWPMDAEDFGLDVLYRGPDGYCRAEEVHARLAGAGVAATFRQEPDGAWGVRFGPVRRDAMLLVLDGLIG